MWSICEAFRSSRTSWSCRPKGTASRSISCSSNLWGASGSARILLPLFWHKDFWDLWSPKALTFIFRCSWFWTQDCLTGFLLQTIRNLLLCRCRECQCAPSPLIETLFPGNPWFPCNNVLWNNFSCSSPPHSAAGFELPSISFALALIWPALPPHNWVFLCACPARYYRTFL